MNNFYLKYKAPIAALLIFVLGGGVFALLNLKIGLFPDITFPKIKIIANIGDQPVDKMMVTVTVPLENAIKKVEQLSIIRSKTSRGSCEISAFLNWGTDIDLGKQRIEARINEIKQELPQGVNISIEKMNPSIFPVLGYSVEAEGESQVELRQLAEFSIKPIIARVDGVSDVAVIGGRVKEYFIILDPIKMSNLGLTPSALSSILSKSNFILSSGLVSDYNRLYLTLTDASINNISDIENTVVSGSSKNITRLKDVAKIEVDVRRDFIKINANGKDVPLIAIIKQPTANLINVSKAVEKQIAELDKVLPAGVKLVPFYNQANFVGNVIKSLEDVLWIGLLLAIIVTILFLRSLKASSVILITIPITLSLTLIFLYVLGYTLNIMTIGAIAAAIGLIIDDAIIVVEQIHRTHEEHPEENSSSLVNTAIKYLLPAMVGSSLSTIVIFLPFVLMSGVAGSYFKVMTDTMIITLVCSFIVVWVILPVIYILLSKEKHSIKKDQKEIKRRGWVNYFIRRPLISGFFSLMLIGASIYILPNLASGFLPEMDEGSLVLDYVSPPGSSLGATNEMLLVIDNILHTIPEVKSFSRRTGTQLGFFITEPNNGDYLIQLNDNRDKTTAEVADKIRKKVEAVLPSLQIEFGQVIGDMLGDLMESAQPIEIKIFGENHEKLNSVADSITSILKDVKGTADVINGIVIAGPEIKFIPDASKLAQYNLTEDDFHFQMQTKIEGLIVGNVLEKNQYVNIRLLEYKNPPSLNRLKNSSIFLNNGKLKPVNEFGSVKVSKGIAEIVRENLKLMVVVTARLDNRDLGSTLKEIKQKISSRLILPPGYEIVYGGAYGQQQKAFSELLIILISAVFLVFIVILFLFRKLSTAFGIMVTAVLGVSGSLIALYITGTPLNVGSYTGIIMIVGIIGENSIFTYLQYVEARKNNKAKDESIIYSISTRLRPKLMTALGAITALAPLALGLGTGAQMHQPLAIAIIGGMILALPLLLVVLPTLLRVIEKD